MGRHRRRGRVRSVARGADRGRRWLAPGGSARDRALRRRDRRAAVTTASSPPSTWRAPACGPSCSSDATSSAARASPRSSRRGSARPRAPTCCPCCATRSGATSACASAGSSWTRRARRSTSSRTDRRSCSTADPRRRDGGDPRALSAADARAFPGSRRRSAGSRRRCCRCSTGRRPTRCVGDAGDLRDWRKLGLLALRHRRELDEMAYLFATSASQYLDEHFEDEMLKSALGLGVDQQHARRALDAGHRLRAAARGRVRGPGRRGRVGVRAGRHGHGDGADGRRRPRGGRRDPDRRRGRARRRPRRSRRSASSSPTARRSARRRVLSNADPKRTFLGLVGRRPTSRPSSSVASRAYRCEGASMKMNLAVAELPRVRGYDDGDGVRPYHRGLVQLTKPLADLDADQASARAGDARRARPHGAVRPRRSTIRRSRPRASTSSRSAFDPSPTACATGTWDEHATTSPTG